jgi:D-hydroxyproline dehydrogenase subunit alpha
MTLRGHSFDVAVIGAGPAGLAAASSARQAGKRVLVIDEAQRAGGQLWRHRDQRQLSSRARAALAAGGDVLHGAAVTDARQQHDGSFELSLLVDATARPVHAARLVLATGARELFLPFPGWTLPGVVGAGGAQALAKGGLPLAGRRVVVAGSGPLLLAVASLMGRCGATVVLVAEQAPARRVARFAASLIGRPQLLLQGAAYQLSARARYRTGSWVTAAHGDRRLEAVTLVHNGRLITVECDLLACGMGLVPNVEVAQLLGCDVHADGIMTDDRCRTTVSGVVAAGECAGIGGGDCAEAEGRIAGLVAAEATVPDALLARRASLRRLAAVTQRAFALRDEVRRLADQDTIVCRCEDVVSGAIDPSWTPRQAKLCTRVGMGSCQGRVCGPALRAMHGWPLDTVRPPLSPVPLAALAGDLTAPHLPTTS